MKKSYILIAILVLSVICSNLFAQNKSYNFPIEEDLVLTNSSLGTEFWVAIPQNEASNGTLAAIGVEIVVTSPYNTTVTLEIPGLGVKRSKQVEAFKQISFSSKDNDITYVQEVNESEEVTQKGIHLTADKPFAAWVLNSRQWSAEGYQAIPLTKWGKEYYHCAYYDFHDQHKRRGGGFIILASEQGTRVTINLNGLGAGQTVKGKKIGETITATLNAGSTFMVRGNGETTGLFDISGTKITSSKTIGVVSFHMRTMIPSICPDDRDNLVEMLTPVDMWGTEFNTIQLDRSPHGSREGKGDLFRIINKESHTTVNCEFYDIASYLKVGNRTLPMNRAAMFGELDPITDISASNKKKSVYGMAIWSSDKPIQLIQNAFSNRWDGDRRFSPMSLIVPPLNQYVRSAVFCTPLNTGFQEHQLTIIALGNHDDPENASLRSIKFDGKDLWRLKPNILQNRIPNTDYYWTRMTISKGAHYFQSDTKLYAYLVGFDSYNAYGYPIVQNFNIIDGLDTVPPKVKMKSQCGNFALEAKEVTLGQNTDNPRQKDVGISKIILFSQSFNYKLTINKPETFKPQNKITVRKFNLTLIDNKKAGKAIFAVMDRAGNIFLDSVSYSPPQIEMKPTNTDFGKVLIGKEKTVTICIKNLNNDDYPINSLENVNNKFKLMDLPKLPIVLHKGDSLLVKVVYSAGTKLQTSIDRDTVKVKSECVDVEFTLMGSIIWPSISVTKSFDFGKVDKGTKICLNDIKSRGLEINNTGSSDLTISKVSGLKIPFMISSPTEPPMPIVLKPGKKVFVNSICFIPQKIGKFSDTLTIESDAAEGDSTFIITGTGKKIISVDNEVDTPIFNISPNPASNELRIKWNTNSLASVRIEIINMVGLVLDRINLDSGKGEISYQLNKFSPGVYSFRLISHSTSISKKVVIFK